MMAKVTLKQLRKYVGEVERGFNVALDSLRQSLDMRKTVLQNEYNTSLLNHIMEGANWEYVHHHHREFFMAAGCDTALSGRFTKQRMFVDVMDLSAKSHLVMFWNRLMKHHNEMVENYNLDGDDKDIEILEEFVRAVMDLGESYGVVIHDELDVVRDERGVAFSAKDLLDYGIMAERGHDRTRTKAERAEAEERMSGVSRVLGMTELYHKAKERGCGPMWARANGFGQAGKDLN
ncbi:MAG: hypothetical protein WAZ18_03825 [Alphaproteobacteria bacterium]